MSADKTRAGINQALEAGKGVLRLLPTWVPRAFAVPGRRLRLDTRDLYALGAHRGGIDERWLASTIRADNGPLTAADEGLSYIYVAEGQKVLLRDAIDLTGSDLLGEDVMDALGGWMMYSKFFDNMYPLPHHVHPDDEYVAAHGLVGKPEAYFFPPQYNFTLNTFPYTFFGLQPGTTREAVIAALKRWNEGDNGILQLSQAIKLTPGTGWYVPPGLLHAPGTLCTYEPQRASDVFSMWQSLLYDGRVVARDLLVRYVPDDKQDDYDAIMAMLDWEANIDPDFVQKYFLEPRPAGDVTAMRAEGYQEQWIVYGSEYFSAKELTILPGRSAIITDATAYGTVCVQGYGRLGAYPVSAPTLIRYGAMTEDEFFVTAGAARDGVEIVNLSSSEPLVLLKHFNPGNPDMPAKA